MTEKREKLMAALDAIEELIKSDPDLSDQPPAMSLTKAALGAYTDGPTETTTHSKAAIIKAVEETGQVVDPNIYRVPELGGLVLTVTDIYDQYKHLFSTVARNVFDNKPLHSTIMNYTVSYPACDSCKRPEETVRKIGLCAYASVQVREPKNRDAAAAALIEVINKAAATGGMIGVLTPLSTLPVLRNNLQWIVTQGPNGKMTFKPTAESMITNDVIFSFFHVKELDPDTKAPKGVESPFFCEEGLIGPVWEEIQGNK